MTVNRRSSFTIDRFADILETGKAFGSEPVNECAFSFPPDEFTIAMLATVWLSLLLPCRGAGAGVFEWLTAAAIALLFFLQGARVSRGAIVAGVLHWRLHLSSSPPLSCCFRSSASRCGRYRGRC